MRFVLASSFVPFVNGGARFIVEWLEQQLLAHGHEVERFYLPFVEDPAQMIDQMALYRMMDLASAGDRLVCFRPPAHLLQHPHKILWFIHHIRAYYDLWDGPHGPPHTDDEVALRSAIHAIDGVALGEAKTVFTNSQVVSDRLQRFNQVASTPLYPPIHQPERFWCDTYGDEIVCVCRVEAHKRQMLLIDAMAHVKTPVRLRLCGQSANAEHSEAIWQRIEDLRVRGRVSFDERWITETEKAQRLSRALAVAYLPEDEDSYGYPSLEAAHSDKAVITTTDSGGVLELVQDGVNGHVCPPDPRALAEAMDRLYLDKAHAMRLGRAQKDRLAAMEITWSHVVEAMTR